MTLFKIRLFFFMGIFLFFVIGGMLLNNFVHMTWYWPWEYEEMGRLYIAYSLFAAGVFAANIKGITPEY